MGTKKRGFPKLLKYLALITFLGIAAIAVAGFIYCNSFTEQVEERFAGRRWRIPSTVYSDVTVLYPGYRIGPADLEERLIRLGYRKTQGKPDQRGEFRSSPTLMEVFLNDLKVPGNDRPGFPVNIRMEGDLLVEMRRIDSGAFVPVLELEPEEIMQFFGKERERRKLVSIAQVPAHVKLAFLAAEDRRFYTHFGVDPRGILRAVYTNLRHGRIRQGGSTLTQQLAKNYFLSHERTFKRKFNELIIALAVERRYEKDEIFEIYLNEIYFGQKGAVSVNGIGEAADFYFGKSVAHLLPEEAAVLAGMVRGPNLYSPFVNAEKCRKRRDRVLAAMRDNKWLPEEEYRKASSAPLTTAVYEPYQNKAPYFMDYVHGQLKELYPDAALSGMGYGIYTTLDTGVQAAAERALKNGLERLESENPELRRVNGKPLQGAVVVMQPRTGNILAMVGGRDYRKSQFNRAVNGFRQPGSCFKPILTAAALDLYRPSDYLSNEMKSYETETGFWSPKNFSEIPKPFMTLREMLTTSCNRAAVDLAVQTGLNEVVQTARKFGFSSTFKPYPSIALGAFEVSPLELSAAYCALGADGVRPFPLSLKDVVDENGKGLTRRHVDIASVLSPAKAFLVTSMLTSVVNEGTGRGLRKMGIHFPVAGKTGTTNGYRDAWFTGYTPDLLALVWVGFDNGAPVNATGARAALPIWAELVKSIPGYVSENDFTIPPGVVKREVCKQSGNLSIKGSCQDVYEEYFLKGNAPESPCDLHRKQNRVDTFLDGVRDLFN